MAITIVEIKGDPTANSYAAVAEADAIFDKLYGYEDWSTLDADTKSRLLITASFIIDGMPIVYKSVDLSQAMTFPVTITGSIDDGFSSAKIATIHQAYHTYQMNDAINEAKIKSVQGVTVEIIKGNRQNTTGFNPLIKYSPEALKIMSKYSDFGMKLSPRYE